MNSIHDNGKNDKTFNEDLDKLRQVYDQLDQEQPPELLDQAILNTAHRAVEKRPQRMRFGWVHGLTTAAVFVLAFSLVLNQREPVPVDENGLINADPSRFQTRSMLKELESSDRANDVSPLEMNVKEDLRQNAPPGVPVGASKESFFTETVLEQKAGKAVEEGRRHRVLEDEARDKSERFDLDAATTKSMQEEVSGDELVLEPVEAEVDEVSQHFHSVTVAAPTAKKMNAPEKEDTEAEQKLRRILELRKNGDERWRAELESFREEYPDYPIPHELPR